MSSPCGIGRSGSLAFPASSLALARRRAGLRGLFRALSRPSIARWSDPHGLRSPSERCDERLFRTFHRHAFGIVRGQCRLRRITLPWPEHVRPPLVGFALLFPLRRHDLVRLLPVSFRIPSASSHQPEVTFRPRGFSPPRRLSPHNVRRLVASCYRPWGSSRFYGLASWRCRQDPGPLPATRITPLEGFPSPAAVRCLHRRCLLAVFLAFRRAPLQSVVRVMEACASTRPVSRRSGRLRIHRRSFECAVSSSFDSFGFLRGVSFEAFLRG